MLNTITCNEFEGLLEIIVERGEILIYQLRVDHINLSIDVVTQVQPGDFIETTEPYTNFNSPEQFVQMLLDLN